MESNCNSDSCASTKQPYRKKLCSMCGMCVNSKNISRHLKSHASQLQCEQCGASFNRYDSLRRHKNHFHKNCANPTTNDVQHTTDVENQEALLTNLINFSVNVPISSEKVVGPDFIQPFSCKILGPRGSGKSSFMVSYVQKIACYTFQKVFIATSTPDQDMYTPLKDIEKVIFVSFEELQTIIQSSSNILVILDDVMQEARFNPTLENLYTRGRHKKISVISLEQDLSYSNHVERRNVDYFVITNIRDRSSLNDFYKRFCQDIQHWRFIDLYNFTMQRFCGYMVLDFVSYNYKYRINSLNKYYNINENKIEQILKGSVTELNNLNNELQDKFLTTMRSFTAGQRKNQPATTDNKNNFRKDIADSNSVESDSSDCE